jgi:surfeit locus 1 family protein
MRRLPLLPTLVVAAAVVIMIALGIWQLQRAGEKRRMLAEYARAAPMAALDLDPLLARGGSELPPLAFRRVLVTCSAVDIEPELRGGRSRDGGSGYSYFVPCRPGARGLAGRLRVNAGWTSMPDDGIRLSLTGVVAGITGPASEAGPVTITSAAAVPPLRPSAPPAIADIPDNHLFYAFQWFFFAGAAVLIYALALRSRRRDLPRPR